MGDKLNKRVPIATILYDDVKFKFITNHYDVHLNGTCIFNGELCEFENEYPDYNEEKDDWEEMFVKIYKLSRREKFEWRKKQFLFEQAVGYHWSYPNKNEKGRGSFYYRKPKWFYKLLFKWYYKYKKKC
jgi:hypothetical protein